MSAFNHSIRGTRSEERELGDQAPVHTTILWELTSDKVEVSCG